MQYIFWTKDRCMYSNPIGTWLFGLNIKCALPHYKTIQEDENADPNEIRGDKISIWTWYSNSMMNYGTFSSGDIALGNVIKCPWEPAVINHTWCGWGCYGGPEDLGLHSSQ